MGWVRNSLLWKSLLLTRWLAPIHRRGIGITCAVVATLWIAIRRATNPNRSLLLMRIFIVSNGNSTLSEHRKEDFTTEWALCQIKLIHPLRQDVWLAYALAKHAKKQSKFYGDALVEVLATHMKHPHVITREEHKAALESIRSRVGLEESMVYLEDHLREQFHGWTLLCVRAMYMVEEVMKELSDVRTRLGNCCPTTMKWALGGCKMFDISKE